jgi:hypothetical protein
MNVSSVKLLRLGRHWRMKKVRIPGTVEVERLLMLVWQMDTAMSTIQEEELAKLEVEVAGSSDEMQPEVNEDVKDDRGGGSSELVSCE